MKTIQTLVFMVCLVLNGSVSAQRPIEIKDDSINYNAGRYPGLIVSIPEVSYDRTQKNWIKELQKGTKSDVITENNEMSIFGAIIKCISPDPVNIYSSLSEKDSLLQLFVTFELKKDLFLDNHLNETQCSSARDYLKQFAKEQYIAFAKDEVQQEEKELGELKNDLSLLEKEKDRMQKSIQSNKSLIITERDNITISNNELNTVSQEIIAQNNQLNTLSEGIVKEEKENYIKDMEKRKKKILNDIESSENKINKAEKDIDDANREIPKNESQQDLIHQKITQQELVVKQYSDKLNTIETY